MRMQSMLALAIGGMLAGFSGTVGAPQPTVYDRHRQEQDKAEARRAIVAAEDKRLRKQLKRLRDQRK